MKNAAAIPDLHDRERPPGAQRAARHRSHSQFGAATPLPDTPAGHGRHSGQTRNALHPVQANTAGASDTPKNDEQVFRLLIESMNEGALTLNLDGTIVFANECFARMVKCPLQQVMGESVWRFFPATDQAVVAPLLKRKTTDSKLLASLQAMDGSRLAARIWILPTAAHGIRNRIVGMVVSDITDAEAGEDALRNLTHHVVQAHEAERGHVALELHQRITQVLCGILFRCQRLAGQIPAHQRAARAEATKISELLSSAAEEVERISRNLRPSILDNLGLVAALGATHAEFVARTGMPLKVSLTPLTVPLTAEADIALFRIHQEALKNVEQHAGARHVTVELTQHHDWVQLTIQDDGAGFAADLPALAARKKRGMGIFSMRERAAAVGGVLRVESASDKGTLIQAQIPSITRITSNHT